MGNDDSDTRQRIIDAAARLFAERGFRKVTVREICHAAGANLAAVNYHFRDKLGLYREVLQRAIAVMKETNAAAERAPAGASAAARLRAHIRVYLHRLLGGGSEHWLHRLINREIADPTPALDAIVEQAIRPRTQFLAGLVGALVGRPPTDERVWRSVASLQAQCVMSLPHPIRDRLRRSPQWTAAEIDTLARHIADFSLAGIRAVGRRAAPRKRPASPGGHSRRFAVRGSTDGLPAHGRRATAAGTEEQ
jgi:AcrR family transcriptional regulator